MKFIVVGYLGQYGSMGQWVVDGLRQIGHEVEAYDRNERIPVKKGVYFFVDCSEDFTANIPEIKYPKVCWLMDSHMPGGLDRGCNLARKCELVISSNYEHGAKLLELNGIESYLVPITYREEYFKPIEKKYDVVMIGNANSQERIRLWEVLKGYNSYCGRIEDLETYSEVMSSAKIVINQPTEPWDIILNNRFFEAMGSNSLLLQKRLQTSLIEKLGFENGRQFIYWNRLSDLPTQLDAVLKDYDSYKDIIESGYLKVKKYEMKEQLLKIESLILSKFYDSL